MLERWVKLLRVANCPGGARVRGAEVHVAHDGQGADAPLCLPLPGHRGGWGGGHGQRAPGGRGG